MPFNQASAWLTLSTLTSSSPVDVWPGQLGCRSAASRVCAQRHSIACMTAQTSHVSTHVSAPMSQLAPMSHTSAGQLAHRSLEPAPTSQLTPMHVSARSSMLGACTHDLSAPCQHPYPMTHASAPAISTLINARSPNTQYSRIHEYDS